MIGRFPRAPFQEHFKSPPTPPFQDHHSKSIPTAPTPPFQETIPRALQHHPFKMSRALQHHEALQKQGPPQNTLSGRGCHENFLHLMVISLCCVLVAVWTGLVISVTSCDRARFPTVVRTIWMQYRGSSCSRTIFAAPPPHP